MIAHIDQQQLHLLQGGRRALFPDTVSERAQRHVRDAMAALLAGHEAVRAA